MKDASSTIAVIGAGIAGLATARELLARGMPVTVYAREIDAPPASSTAPALFTPYAGPDHARFERWTRAAYARLADLAERHPAAGVTMGTLREYFYARPVRFSWLDELLGTTHREATLPFVEISDSWRPHIDMMRLVPWLRGQVLGAGGVIIARDVESFESVFQRGHRTIVHCAGVGAMKLASDPLVKPMHGQVVHVPNSVGLEHSIHDDAPGGIVTYIFRYQDRLVIGGTFDHATVDRGTDDESIHAMLDRARHLLRVDGVANAELLGDRIIQARSALRPTRGAGSVCEDLRLEREEREGGTAIVHHYGHGRAGATLALATAGEAADLALSG